MPASQGWNRRRIRAAQQNNSSNFKAAVFPEHLRLLIRIPQTDRRLETEITTKKILNGKWHIRKPLVLKFFGPSPLAGSPTAYWPRRTVAKQTFSVGVTNQE
jgi:hypothetical protein